MTIEVEVAYVAPGVEFLRRVKLDEGATAADAIEASKLRDAVPGVAIEDRLVGIWSNPCGLAASVRDGDRVEVYRPLAADPKELRRLRAQAQRTTKR